jgi:hypothetical protein
LAMNCRRLIFKELSVIFLLSAILVKTRENRPRQMAVVERSTSTACPTIRVLGAFQLGHARIDRFV